MEIPIHEAMTRQLAESICGKLSHTTKMPCASYSLPVARCVAGSVLAQVEGSVCSKCYAKRGRHIFHQNAQESRWLSLRHPRWVAAICHLIAREENPHFRWHDCGDLAGYWHLDKIVQVACAMPAVSFWLPTAEAGVVARWLSDGNECPTNLTIRVSAAMIDGKPKASGVHTSTVHKLNSPIGTVCIASIQNGKCLACRACWDKTIKNVSYKYH